TMTRPPLAADRALQGLQLPWRLALTMKDDHVATLPLVHWPSPVAPGFPDLRRVPSYPPVLARGASVNDYFPRTARPAGPLRPEGPLRASQFTDEGVWAVVDLPAFGYAWVPKESDLELPPAPTGALSVRGRVLRNESMLVEIDPATGGLRGLMAAGEEIARL